MAVITLPSKVLFESVSKLQLVRAGLTLRSRYTGKRQHILFPFALWGMQGKLIPMRGSDAGEWRAFLAQLQGERNTFRLPIPGTEMGPLSGYAGPHGNVSVAAGARATSITIDGLTPSTPIVAKGDYFNIGDELKLATTAVAANGSGVATLTFEPFLRTSVATGIDVTFADPFMYVSAEGNDSASWSLTRPVDHGIDLTVVEAVES